MTNLPTTIVTDLRPYDAAGTFIGVCGKCKAVHVITGTRAYGRLNGRTTDGWLSSDGEYVKQNENYRAVCGCGQSVYGVELLRVKARITEHTCGSKCRNSKGPTCDCSCGGKNHGQGYAARSVRLAA